MRPGSRGEPDGQPVAARRPRGQSSAAALGDRPGHVVQDDATGAQRALWCPAEPGLEKAQHNALLLAIRDQGLAGLDPLGDGEIRRESCCNRVAHGWDGLDLVHPGKAINRIARRNPLLRVVGPIRRTWPVEVYDARFSRADTDREIKVTVLGSFTMTQLARDDYQGDKRATAMDQAVAVRENLRDPVPAGVDFVQIDEPYMAVQPETARTCGQDVLNRALRNVPKPVRARICRGHPQFVAGRLSGDSVPPKLAVATCQQMPSRRPGRGWPAPYCGNWRASASSSVYWNCPHVAWKHPGWLRHAGDGPWHLWHRSRCRQRPTAD